MSLSHIGICLNVTWRLSPSPLTQMGSILCRCSVFSVCFGGFLGGGETWQQAGDSVSTPLSHLPLTSLSTWRSAAWVPSEPNWANADDGASFTCCCSASSLKEKPTERLMFFVSQSEHPFLLLCNSWLHYRQWWAHGHVKVLKYNLCTVSLNNRWEMSDPDSTQPLLWETGGQLWCKRSLW